MKRQFGFFLSILLSSWLVGQIQVSYGQFSTYECSTAYGCSNIAITDVIVKSLGYKGVTGSSTIVATASFGVGNGAHCMGAYSCSDILSIDADKSSTCWGANSCSKTASITGNYVRCQGAVACDETTISSRITVECTSSQSCSNSNIASPIVYGAASYSLMNSVITSVSDLSHATSVDPVLTYNLHVELTSHYSGYNTHIICEAGHSCNIECAGNGCYNTQLTCLGTCSVSGCDAGQNLCPNNVNLGASTSLASNIFDIKTVGDLNDDLCNAPNAIAYDDYVSDTFYNNLDLVSGISDGNICCRHYKACSDARSLTTLNNNNNIICSGQATCQNIDLIQTPCDGSSSVICTGVSSCFLTAITAANYIYCTTCAATTLFNTNTVYCDGVFGCAAATIYNVENVFLIGSSSPKIITNNDNSVLNVFAYGAGSGDGVSVYCDASDTCNIDCGTTPDVCDGMILYCRGNCNLICDDTMTTCPTYGDETLDFPSVFIPSGYTDCPITTTSPSDYPSDYPTDFPSLSPTTCEDDDSCGSLDGSATVIIDEGSNFELNCFNMDGCGNIDLYCNGECTIKCDESKGVECPNVKCGDDVIYVDCIDDSSSGGNGGDSTDGTCNVSQCDSAHCAATGDNPFCSDQQAWGCSFCQSGYWMLSHEYPCIQCSTIDHCQTCQDWQGCTQCQTGHSLYWDSQCLYGKCS